MSEYEGNGDYERQDDRGAGGDGWRGGQRRGGYRGGRDRDGGHSGGGGRRYGGGGKRGGSGGRSGFGGFDITSFSSSGAPSRSGSSAGKRYVFGNGGINSYPKPQVKYYDGPSLASVDSPVPDVVPEEPGKLKEPEPLDLEEPKSSFNLDCMKFMQALREEKDLFLDRNGIPIIDCRGTHGVDTVCQFCDGRRGSWVSETAAPTEAFKRYQESIINSRQAHYTSNLEPDNVLSIAAKEKDENEDEEDGDFGLGAALFEKLAV